MKPLNSPSFGANRPQHTNGKVETLLDTSGVSSLRPPTRRAPTTFAPDAPVRGLGPLLYALTRFEFGGMQPTRVLAALWLVIAALGVTGLVPFAPVWIVVGAGLMILQVVLVRRWRTRDFVEFRPQPIPLPDAHRLPPADKLAVHVTGLCHVEGKLQRFAFLPGFYRTFATGEHALLCQARDRRLYAVLRWPSDEVGMWYAFVKPIDIRQLAWGELRFGATTTAGIALTYELELLPGPQRKRAKQVQETLYIAASAEDARRIFADLLHQLPSTAAVTPAIPTYHR